MNIKVIHTIDGRAPIIAKCEKVNRCDYYTLEDPFVLLYYRDEDGNERVRVENLLVFAAKNEITVKTDHVMFMYDPSDETVEFYNKHLNNEGTND